MTTKELKLIRQLTEVAMTVAELKAENKILKDINEKLMQALRIHDVVGRSKQLNCDHEWKVEAFDCYGIPYEQYCEHCGKKEAI